MSPRFVRPHADGMHAQAPHQRSMRLSPRYRRLAYGVLALAWVTGILWLVFHYFLNRQGEFGSEPHPLETWWLRLHGVAAFASLWLGGLLWGLHVRPGLARPNRRISGIVLIVLFAVLALTGYLLYYASADWLHDGVRLVHWLVGLFLVLPFLIHSLRARAARQIRSDRKA